MALTILNLSGSVALLLWGVHMVQTGVQRAFGSRLHSLLGRALKNRFGAFFAGVGVTALLQSSTVTGLMVTGFAANGLVDLVPALAVMLGANVGTTLIVQLLSFNIVIFAPGLILIGVLMFRRASAEIRDFGRVLIGLGLVLMALFQFVSVLESHDNISNLGLLLGAISNRPIFDVVVAAGLTWAAHSSVAVVLVIMSMASKGTISPEAAYAMVLGANLGTTINPVLESKTGPEFAAKRLPLGNFTIRLISVAIGFVALPYVSGVLGRIEPNNARSVADFHTAFNVIIAIVFYPLLSPLARMLIRWIPSRTTARDPGMPIYLDLTAQKAPMLALGDASREALRMADVVEAMLTGLKDAFEKANRYQIIETKRLDDILDKLNTAIKSYITSLDPEGLCDADHSRLVEILAFATNMEHAGDIIDKNLLGIANKVIKRGLTFSSSGQAELVAMIDRLIVNIRTAASLFMTGDQRAARLLAKEKEVFRSMEAIATEAHFRRLRAGYSDTVETSTMHLDVLRDLKSVNASLVAAAAYPILDRRGELLPTRLRADP